MWAAVWFEADVVGLQGIPRRRRAGDFDAIRAVAGDDVARPDEDDPAGQRERAADDIVRRVGKANAAAEQQRR